MHQDIHARWFPLLRPSALATALLAASLACTPTAALRSRAAAQHSAPPGADALTPLQTGAEPRDLASAAPEEQAAASRTLLAGAAPPGAVQGEFRPRTGPELGGPVAAVSLEQRSASRRLASAARGRSPDEPYPQTLINFGDAQYIMYLRIGKQILAGMVETGSFELVVFGADCRSCGVAAHYNPSLSATFRSGRLVSQQAYGSGTSFSTASADVLQIRPFEEARQSFWTVQKASMPTLAEAAFEALIGLGPPEAPASDAWKAVTAVISNVTSYYDVAEKAPAWLMKQVDKRLEIADEMSVKTTLLNNLDVTTFSVCLGPTARSNGIIVWNDAASLDQPGVFARVPVTGVHTWSTSLSNLSLAFGNSTVEGEPNGTNASSELPCMSGAGCSAILDTGMSLIAAPRSVVARLHEAVLQLDPDCGNLDVLPDLVFELGGRSFSLPPEAYVAQVEGDIPDYLANLIRFNSESSCQLLLLESNAVTTNGPLWILGMPFFRHYYTTFHLGSSREDRAFYIAEAGQDCSPVSLGQRPQADSRAPLRRVDLQKVHLPQTARIATKDQLARL